MNDFVGVVAKIISNEMGENATLLAENVFLLETLKQLAERDELAAGMLEKFMEMRAELRGTS